MKLDGHNNAPGPPPTHSLKRRASEDAVPISPLSPPQNSNTHHPNQTPHHPPLKKFVLAGPWDLEIGSNVVSFQIK